MSGVGEGGLRNVKHRRLVHTPKGILWLRSIVSVFQIASVRVSEARPETQNQPMKYAVMHVIRNGISHSQGFGEL